MKQRRSNSFKQSPGNAFIVAAVVFVFLSFFQIGGLIDIHVHDTMFVIPSTIVGLFLAALSGIEFLIYRFLGFLMYNSKLSWIHLTLTVLSFVLVIISLALPQDNYPLQSLSSENWKKAQEKNNLLFVLIFSSFFLGQIVLAFNVVLGAARKLHFKT